MTPKEIVRKLELITRITFEPRNRGSWLCKAVDLKSTHKGRNNPPLDVEAVGSTPEFAVSALWDIIMERQADACVVQKPTDSGVSANYTWDAKVGLWRNWGDGFPVYSPAEILGGE
jgi:hypothetical protein